MAQYGKLSYWHWNKKIGDKFPVYLLLYHILNGKFQNCRTFLLEPLFYLFCTIEDFLTDGIWRIGCMLFHGPRRGICNLFLLQVQK